MTSLGKVRIIGGKWRGRKLNVVNDDSLRPTPDRTRETLFNWLQGSINGARCLDLFAGTGALGFEALSRGASEVLMVEADPIIADSLRQSADNLECNTHMIECVDALNITEKKPGNFDIIFVDPPFKHGYIEKCCQMIIEYSLLKPNGMVYIESEKDVKIPSKFIISKETQTTQTRSVLTKLEKSI